LSHEGLYGSLYTFIFTKPQKLKSIDVRIIYIRQRKEDVHLVEVHMTSDLGHEPVP
jgi:hypothetical protein